MDLMTMLRRVREHLLIDYMMSEEVERIRNPKRDDAKYTKYIKTLITCGDVFRDTEGKVSGDDPDFPKGNHIVIVSFKGSVDDVAFVNEAKAKLAGAIKDCDEFVIHGQPNGNVDFVLGFNDIYTDKGKS